MKVGYKVRYKVRYKVKLIRFGLLIGPRTKKEVPPESLPLSKFDDKVIKLSAIYPFLDSYLTESTRIYSFFFFFSLQIIYNTTTQV